MYTKCNKNYYDQQFIDMCSIKWSDMIFVENIP